MGRSDLDTQARQEGRASTELGHIPHPFPSHGRDGLPLPFRIPRPFGTGNLGPTPLLPSTLGVAESPCFFLSSDSSLTISSRSFWARSKSSTLAAASISS